MYSSYASTSSSPFAVDAKSYLSMISMFVITDGFFISFFMSLFCIIITSENFPDSRARANNSKGDRAHISCMS